mmetsp:Transcript_23483/g.35529  ORF Transcript_23483/g.35529 Transcript_23483/m.35529 type:complete len:426 (-) Transcript_23483:2366-3643(-)
MLELILFGDNGSSSAPSCESCGWLWAIGGMLAFGSFGVPIKSKVMKSVDIDPLVMQSYKTGMCFITSVIILLYRGEEVTFTPWGIVSGLFWVPGGIAMIYAIKTAGLAIAMGVGTSFIVLVSFSWGIFFFDEHVHSRLQACLAVACMLCGLAGMAYYSAPTVAHISQEYQSVQNEDSDTEGGDFGMEYHAMDTAATDDELGHKDKNQLEDTNNARNESLEAESAISMVVEDGFHENPRREESTEPSSITSVSLCCYYIRVQERTLGILAALVVTGLWSGSMMVPMEFAPKIDKGLPFLASFAIGATLVTMFFWFIRYLYLCHKHHYSFIRAYQALPSFYFKKAWPYGTACGLLWSIGNFCSILSIGFLGEGVGFSVIQASMLVSGLWGIFCFREIEGANAISKWYIAASVTVTGILLLSYEHHEP